MTTDSAIEATNRIAETPQKRHCVEFDDRLALPGSPGKGERIIFKYLTGNVVAIPPIGSSYSRKQSERMITLRYLRSSAKASSESSKAMSNS